MAIDITSYLNDVGIIPTTFLFSGGGASFGPFELSIFCRGLYVKGNLTVGQFLNPPVEFFDSLINGSASSRYGGTKQFLRNSRFVGVSSTIDNSFLGSWKFQNVQNTTTGRLQFYRYIGDSFGWTNTPGLSFINLNQNDTTKFTQNDINDLYLAVMFTPNGFIYGYDYSGTFYASSVELSNPAKWIEADSTSFNDVAFKETSIGFSFGYLFPYYTTTSPGVIIYSNEKGDASQSAVSPAVGDIVNISITANPGEVVDQTTTTLTSITAILPVWDSAIQFHFTMPANTVIVNLGFVTAPAIKWEVWVSGSYGGLVTVDKIHLDNGEEVTMTFFIESGYRLNKTATSVVANGRRLPITWVSDTVATFNAPTSSPTSEDTKNIWVYPVFDLEGGEIPPVTPGGGDGAFDDSSDSIAIPNPPSIDIANSGFVTLFLPFAQDLADLGNILWTDAYDVVTNIKKFFANPADFIISLHAIPKYITPTGIAELQPAGVRTYLPLNYINTQWVDHDFGSITIEKYFGSAFDFSPYTKITLMLPFIGDVALNVDEVMGKTLGLHYRIDILTGACIAFLTINNSLAYQFTGNISISFPISSNDWSRVYSSIISAAGSIAGGLISGVGIAGAVEGAAMSAGSTAIQQHVAYQKNRMFIDAPPFTPTNNAGHDIITGGMPESSIKPVEQTVANVKTKDVAKGLYATTVAKSVESALSNVMSAKSFASHGGSLTGSGGFMGSRVPYVIIEYPNPAESAGFKDMNGYPSQITTTIGNLSGYTECQAINPVGFTGLESELAEILDALKNGVYV